jgi:hypothetical protein
VPNTPHSFIFSGKTIFFFGLVCCVGYAMFILNVIENLLLTKLNINSLDEKNLEMSRLLLEFGLSLNQP